MSSPFPFLFLALHLLHLIITTIMSSALIPSFPEVKTIRERLFLLAEQPIDMPITEFESNWPYVDNIWCKRNSRTYPDRIVTHYRCRRHRKEWNPVSKDKGAPQQHPIRAGQQCLVGFNATHYIRRKNHPSEDQNVDRAYPHPGGS